MFGRQLCQSGLGLNYHPEIAIPTNKMSEHTLNDSLLICHPSATTDTIERFTASTELSADGWLRFRYEVQGNIGRIALPVKTTPRHTDNLWRHTCFEAFISAEDDPAYVECNFAPSAAWAAYQFARYRKGMSAIVPVEPPRITLKKERDSLVLEAQLKLGEFADSHLRIGLTAVIEDTAGGISYWALRHPKAKPDFHHRGGFILRLAAP